MKPEEKARAYDKVRKKIAIRFGSNVADEFFAEFEESEDEKVRKEIINYFQCQSEEEPTRKEIHNKWIDWLEKQGEHANFRNKIQVGDKVTRNEAGVLVNLSQLKMVAKPREKQGEKKPLGYVHHIDEDGYYTKEAILEPNPYTGTGFDYNGHHWGMCARDGGVEILMDGNITSRVFPDKNNIIEQKPTDSYCKENCKGFQETGKCFADGECKAKRESDQKPEENKGNIGGISPNWSEEDEMVRKDLIGFFKDEAFLCHKKKQIIAWLKKQGDSPIKWNKNTKDCKPQKNHSVLMKTTHGIAEGEWQGEKWFQYRWSSSIKDSDVLFWIELSDIEKQGETFPVLSNSSNSGKNEQKPADIFIEKACEWLREHKDYVATEDNGISGWTPERFIERLKKYLEEQV